MNRLRFAPDGTRTLRVDDYLLKPHYDEKTGEPFDSHFEITCDLTTAIESALLL